ncbi:MAG: glycosyltransferase family 39 protein, partial [Bacteroidales bacterium]|nr:glycosyltransferase family 39 protein [Bacteroidales bacterium]
MKKIIALVFSWFMNVGILPVLLVAFSLLVAINVYDSYGISWDEANQREIGLVNAEYVLGKSDVLLTYKDRDYGPAFELFLLVAEKVANADSFREIFLVRHLVSHFFFILGGLFCFLLVKLLFNNKLLAVFSFLLWILMPVFYAHSFFNTKDIPFASMMMVAFYYSVLAWKRPT